MVAFRVAIVPFEATTATRKLGLRDQLGMPLGDACARRTGRQPGAVHVKNSRQPGHALADDHVVGDVVGANRRRIGADIRTPARSQDLIDGRLKIVVSPVRVWVSPFDKAPLLRGLVLCWAWRAEGMRRNPPGKTPPTVCGPRGR